jgi:hypothetical protein
MATTIKPTELPTQLERFVLADGRVNPVWYRYFKTNIGAKEDDRRLAGIVDGQEIAINDISGIVDGVGAQWGVSISVNNHVTGLVRLDSTATTSTFTILADKFVVALPSNPTGVQITAFVAGLVGGVPTVGINGNLIVDGTILANAISVATLSAISANVGTVTAGLIRSTDSKVQLDLTNGTFSITT